MLIMMFSGCHCYQWWCNNLTFVRSWTSSCTGSSWISPITRWGSWRWYYFSSKDDSFLIVYLIKVIIKYIFIIKMLFYI